MKNLFRTGVLVISIITSQMTFAQTSGKSTLEESAFKYVVEKIGSIKQRPWKVTSSSYDEMPNGDKIVKLTISRTITYQEEGFVPITTSYYGATFVTGYTLGETMRDEEDKKTFLVFVNRLGTPTAYTTAPANHVFHYWQGNPWLIMNKHKETIGGKEYNYFNNLVCYNHQGDPLLVARDMRIYDYVCSDNNVYLVGKYHNNDISVVRIIDTKTLKYKDRKGERGAIPYQIDFSDEGIVVTQHKSNNQTSTYLLSYTEEEIYEDVEQSPSFPGGEKAQTDWIEQNLQYPIYAKTNGIQGRVWVQVVVNKDGSISDPNVLFAVDSSLEQEALRLVQTMPKWNPGKQHDEAVRVRLTVPITFKLR